MREGSCHPVERRQTHYQYLLCFGQSPSIDVCLTFPFFLQIYLCLCLLPFPGSLFSFFPSPLPITLSALAVLKGIETKSKYQQLSRSCLHNVEKKQSSRIIEKMYGVRIIFRFYFVFMPMTAFIFPLSCSE